MSKKVFVLVPDGVGLRNFAYTSFYKMGKDKGYEIVFWNATPFDVEELGFQQIRIQHPRLNTFTDVLKSARIRIELSLFAKRDKDPIYHEYLFPLSYKTVRRAVKSLIIRWYVRLYSSEKGLEKIRLKIINSERKTAHYNRSKSILETERPDMVFCTSQRAVTTIAPLTAAQDLGIPTTSFIFSWDNIPKATTVGTTDFYFVWSEHMKKELLHYQKYITSDQIRITGTPQFEPHFEDSRLLSRELFCSKNNLNPNIRYICFSGDDITTSPKDELYLRDLAIAVRILNNKGFQLKIIYRKCPVDFSSRYDEVLYKYEDVIVNIPPLWKKIGDGWNSILPLPEDLDLQVNIIFHSDCVINLASSMVFDFVSQGKPCGYMNYNYLNPKEKTEKGVYIYDYVHFRSMPSSDAVIWFEMPDTIAIQLEHMLEGVPHTISAAKDWFELINIHPPQDASKRMWDDIEKIIQR